MNENHPPEVEAQDDDPSYIDDLIGNEEIPDPRDEMDDN